MDHPTVAMLGFADRTEKLEMWTAWLVQVFDGFPCAPLQSIAGMMRFWDPTATDEEVWDQIQLSAAKIGRYVLRDGGVIAFGTKPLAA